jgi:hypothetical protein
MIRYDLACDAGHEFDSWFRDSATFDVQAGAGELACPVCGSRKVTKRLMAPGVPVRSNRTVAALADGKSKAVREAIRKLRRHVESNADYVGAAFPDEARRIYYKEAEERGIYGEASLEEAKGLRDEGIEIFPLPPAPEDKN